ncbi:MAG: sarcosine oxidase subunit gamma [Gemmatimonadetes bacterium]|nr:sarcosine oxidase subunit gamma [Gemmatimonadota bacterium]
MTERLPVDPAIVARMTAASSPAAALRALPLPLMASVRARGAARARVAAALGLEALPGHGPMAEAPAGRVTWLRPDEWLVEAPVASRGALVAALAEAVREGTPEAEGAVVELSASRHRLELAGPRTREVLAAVCALDLHPRAFPVGHATQTLLGRAPVLLQLVDDAPTWRLLVRPSFVAYVVEWLADAMEGA